MKKKIIYISLIVLVGVLGLVLKPAKKSEVTKSIPTVGSYVALGDSISAGVGLENYSDSSACDRTNESYPNIVAKKLNYDLKNLSCSGASITQGIKGSQDVNDLKLSPQIDKLFSLPKPNLITITVGANDVKWIESLTKCYTGTCGTADDNKLVDQQLKGLNSNLTGLLINIRENYKNESPEVVLTGYYQLLPSVIDTTCPEMKGLDKVELIWQRAQISKLNQVLSEIAKGFNFVKYADINFDGHELCSSDPWVQNLVSKAPYHPNDKGQVQIAKAIK